MACSGQTSVIIIIVSEKVGIPDDRFSCDKAQLDFCVRMCV